MSSPTIVGTAKIVKAQHGLCQSEPQTTAVLDALRLAGDDGARGRAAREGIELTRSERSANLTDRWRKRAFLRRRAWERPDA